MDKSAPFLSFIPLLRKYLDQTKPKLILEWGTGVSTGIMIRRCPDAIIHTIEHDLEWFNKWHGQYGKSGGSVYFYYIPLDKGYSTFPLNIKDWGLFDFVLVDGRERVKCLQTAFKVMNPDAVVMLHDSERPAYAEGKALFRIIEECDGTAVMKK